jgi:hypothetical protein
MKIYFLKNNNKNILLSILIALFLASIFHQDLIWTAIYSNEEKTSVPLQANNTKLGDHHYYYISSKKVYSNFKQFIFDKPKGPEKIYIGALFFSGFIDRIAKLIPINWRHQVSISLIMQLACLFFSLIILYSSLRNKKSINFIELILFASAWAYLCRPVIYAIFTNNIDALFKIQAISFYPDIFRIVNPQMGWAYSLAYIALLTTYIKSKTNNIYITLIIASIFLSSFSIPIAATIFIGLSIYIFIQLISEKKIELKTMGICLAILISLIITRYHLQLFSLTEKGMNIHTGSFVKVTINSHYLWLLLFIPIFSAYISAELKKPIICIYIAALLIGMICQSFYLGSRLWIRGSGVIIWFFILYGLFEFIRHIINSCGRKITSNYGLSLLICIIITFLIYRSLNVNTNNWFGYINSNKAGVIEWLNKNGGAGEVVVSADLEDAYLIPIYTNLTPYVQLYDYSHIKKSELIKRYFQVLDLYQLKDYYTDRIVSLEKKDLGDIVKKLKKRPSRERKSVEYQVYTFYSMILYYPYDTSVKSIFLSQQQNSQFDNYIRKASENSYSEKIKDINFLIYNKKTQKIKANNMKTVYENKTYKILTP